MVVPAGRGKQRDAIISEGNHNMHIDIFHAGFCSVYRPLNETKGTSDRYDLGITETGEENRWV